MAISASKSKTLTSSNSRSYTLTASFTESSYSVANNTSTLSLTAKLAPTTSRWSTSYNSTLAIYWYDNYTGKETLVGSTTFAGLSSTSDVKSVTKSYTVTHKSDGSLSGYAKAVFTKGSTTSSYAPASGNVSTATTVLTTIPRASSFGTVSGSTLGSAITININRNSSSFTHTLWYSFGSKTWQGIASSVGTSTSFTPPLSLCSEIPSATSGTMTLILRTYNGSTQVGSDVTKTITVNVPSTVVPTISSVAISEGNTSVVPTSWGVYVQNKSKLKFVTTASAGTGSSISSITTTINGTTYTGSTITTNVITASGNLTATITVKDKRGRTASTTKTVSIVAYSNPYVSKFTVIRCDSKGNALDTGEYVKVTIAGGFSSVSSKNTGSYAIYYKKSTDSSYTKYALSATTNTISTSVKISGFDSDHSYQFYGATTDYFTTSKSAVANISTALVTTDYLDGGKGIAFGKVAENTDEADFNFKIRARKGIALTGTNTIASTSDDYTGNWGTNYNNSVHFYTQTGQLRDQPSQYGFLLNIGASSEVHQLWMTQPNGGLYHRGGNGQSGWSGTWKVILDSSNYTSYCAKASHTHSYLPLSGGTLTGTLVTKNTESIMALNSSGTKKALIGISEGNNLYIGSATSGNATGNTNIYASAGQVNINGTTKTQFGTTSDFSPMIYLGYASGWATTSAIGSYWADSTGHEILTKSSDGLTTGVGWAGSTSYKSVVNIRSMSCDFRGTAKWSSDKNLKKDIVSFDDKMEEFYDNLNPVSYKYILGNSGRPHCGFVAQSVEEALNKAGLSTDDFAGITIDTISQRETEQDEDGNDVDIYGSEINYLLDNGIDKKYCLAYNEFVALNTWQIQKLKIENKEFKTLLQEQQKIINDLLDKYNKLITDNN